MGDAGPPTPPLVAGPQIGGAAGEHETPAREVTVLVTGFGPFKSFATNPSYLIASALPSILQPQPSKPHPVSSDGSSTPPPYRIRLIVHPTPIRVAYATIASLVPTLIAQHKPDYVFHIGMAGGRDHYTLETIAHRDNYKIRDVDDRDGWKEGEYAWKKDGVPEKLSVGWDEEDVCSRWEGEVREVEEALGLVDADRTAASLARFGEWGRDGRRRFKSVCRLSVDAGRFLCEFTMFESLAWRWLEANKEGEREGDERESLREKEGKVAFLHVPGAFGPEDVERGSRVAIAAIRSLVGSWEEGKRRKDEQERTLGGKVDSGRWDGVVWRA